MSPAPDLSDETIILHSLPTAAVLNAISSSDELDQHQFNEHRFDLGSLSLAVESMDSIDLSDDDDEENANEREVPALTEGLKTQLTTCSAPSTPTGERDPPVAFRRSSITSTTNNELPQIEVKYQGVRNTPSTNSDDGNGLIDTFFGCFKPLFSAVNKIGENIRYHRETTPTISTVARTTDDWYIPIDSIMNDLLCIGTGIEGTVYLGKLGGQNVACKRVRTEEETNIKHLRKLNHVNIVKFRGVSISSPLFYIVMEYCPYGALYDVLKRRREKKLFTKPTQVLDWARQISHGVNYLHSNKLVHRDLKSPNILISDGYVLKISDFGTSKQMVNRQSQLMSFNGTTAWMAPEVIRQEPCSEKIDVWSFGIVVWEILTCAVPYHNIDPVAIMWGVGKGSLTLTIPSSAPEGFKLLMAMCWNQRPAERYSFQQIIKHLNISEPQIALFEREQEYVELNRAWSAEINEQLARLPAIDITATLQMSNDELMKKRKEEMQHIADIRLHYQTKLQQINTVYLELSSLMMQLQKREQEIKKKERDLKIQHHSSPSNNNGKKRTIKTISEARVKSLQVIKAASLNFPVPMAILSQTPTKKVPTAKSNIGLSNHQPSVNLHGTSNQPNNIKTSLPSSPPVINNQDSSSIKTTSRRKKGPGHRRNNSKGSVTSWTPPSLSFIAAQEDKRAPINITQNMIEETNSIFNASNGTIQIQSSKALIPSISADIDSKINNNNRQLNPKELTLDLENPINVTKTFEQPTTLFTYAPRKSSSSDPEDLDQHHNIPRQRRLRTYNQSNNRIASPSSLTSRSTKASLPDQSTPQADEITKADNQNDQEKSKELRKYSRNVTFHISPSTLNDRSPSHQQRKTSNRHATYSSSEEGEVEEVHSDHYVLDDKKHRAKHEDLNRQSYGLFSSESEIYSETNQRSSSSKNESNFSDEGGHVSDERPASRESLLNSEPEHE